MEIFKTKIRVLKETQSSLHILCAHGQVYSTKAHGKTTATPTVIRLSKKYVLPGSDCFFKVEEDDKPVKEGMLFLPEWIATRHQLWNRSVENDQSSNDDSSDPSSS